MPQGWTPRPHRGSVPGREQQASSGSRATRVAIGAISLLGVGTIVLCIVALVVTQARKNRPVVLEAEVLAEKQAELRAAFSAPDVGVDPVKLAAIEQLFDQVIAATSESEEEKFQTLVDRDRMFEAMQASEQMPRMWTGDAETVRAELPGSLWIPWHATRYRIAHVRLLPDDGEAVVYGYFWTADGEAAEMRWWIIQRAGTWKPYDWELLQFGARCSRELALYQRVDTSVYSQVFHDLHAAREAFSNDEVDEGRQRMRRAERMLPLVPEALRDEAKLWTAYYWYYGGHHDEARGVAEQVSFAGRKPGVYYLQLQRAAHHREHEQLLASAREYEAAIGRNPNSAQLRATAFQELGRLDEAADACRDYLRCDPGNVDMLRQLVLTLRRDDSRELTEQVAAARDPVETAAVLADSLSVYADSAAIAALVEFVDRKAPGTAQAAALHAVLADTEFDDQAAAQWYLQALQLESDPSTRPVRLWRYLAVMTRRDLAVEAFRSVPDPKPAFANLANSDEEPESALKPDVLRSLLAEYERRGGAEDPGWWLHSGNLAAADGDEPRAIDCYERGLKLDNDDDESDTHWMLESQLTDALIRQGRWRDAWSRAADEDDQRESVADRLQEMKRFSELAELAASWRESDPEQPLAEYYAAVVAIESGDVDEAERLIDQGETKLGEDGDEHRRNAFHTARVSAWMKADDPLAHYDQLAGKPDLVRQLAWRLSRQGRRAEVLALADRLRADDPQSAHGWYWAIRLRWEVQDYAGVEDLLNEFPPPAYDKLEPDERAECDEYRLRSRLRMQRFNEALTHAAAMSRREDDPRWLVVANAAAERGGEVRALLPRLSEYRFNSVYSDEDAGAFLLGSDCTSLRAAFPPWLSDARDSGWLALLREPCSFTAADIHIVVSDAWGNEAATHELAHPLVNEPRTFVIARGAQRFAVTCGVAPYTQADMVHFTAFEDPRAAEALRQHCGWIAVTPIASPGPVPDERSDGAQARDLLRRLSADRLLAVYNPDGRQLVPTGAELDRLLAPASGPEAWSDAGEIVWLWRGSQDQDLESAVRERIRRRLNSAGLALWRDNEDQFQASLRVGNGFDSERIDVRVERTRPGPYSGFQYDGRILYDSQLVPWLKTGELVRFSEYDVIDWSAPGEEATARDEAERWWRQTRADAAGDGPLPERHDADHPGH